ncbi:MAG TPA: LacI family transcriptional regulator, partial [Clostridiales bacterium]|nr:LacI family transcriptional regulator [Clostridiales bacterium]
MAATLKDVAKKAGVSPATVSRVMNGNPRISEKTRKIVLECAQALDYRINALARGLKTNRTYTVGFLCPDISNNFFMSVAKGVEEFLRHSGYSLLVCDSGDTVSGEKERLRLLIEKSI